jgi:hypothetical protein
VKNLLVIAPDVPYPDDYGSANVTFRAQNLVVV